MERQQILPPHVQIPLAQANLYKRLSKQFCDIMKGPFVGITVSPVDTNNIQEWIVHIQAQSNTPYAGCLYKLFVQVPLEYPFRPPKINFLTKIVHANINFQDGLVRLDILEDQHSPANTIYKILLSIKRLMGKPDYPETMSQEDIRLFEEEAREYAQAHTPKIKS